MYLSHYNLKTEPFKITTDPEFLWLGEKHKEALATLKYGIMGNKGILLLTGDVGTGKTTLIHALLNSLDEDTIVATVPDPGLDKMDFFNFVASAFNIQKTFYSKGDFTLYLSHFLKSANAEHKKVLLIIDEAQRLNKDLLEEIRLLSNIELQHTKLINLFFVGQKEFNDIILLDENKALRQRISLRYNIEPLNLDETREYIKYRLQVAGSKKNLFTSNAVSEIYSFSKGYPRLINILCDYALLSGFVRDKQSIGRQIVRECAEELKIPHQNSKDGGPQPREPRVDENSAVSGPWASTEKRKNARGLRFFKWAGTGILLALLLMGLGVGFYEESKPWNLNASWNHLGQKVNAWMGQVYHWIRTDRASVTEENKGVSVVLPESEDARGTSPAPGTGFEDPKRSPPESRGDLPSRTANPEIQRPAPPAPSQPQGPEGSITQALSSPNEKHPVPSPGDTHPAMDEKRLPASQVALEKLPAESGMSRPDQERVLPPDKAVPAPETRLQESALPPMPQGIPLTADRLPNRPPPARKIVIFFDSNSFTLSGDARSSLGQILEFINQNPQANLIVRGYTDDSGPLVYNERLSIFRAYSVKSFLVDQGLDPLKVKAFGMGPRPALDEAGNRIPAQLTRSVEVEMYLD